VRVALMILHTARNKFTAAFDSPDRQKVPAGL
jgi:hypothetical protein